MRTTFSLILSAMWILTLGCSSSGQSTVGDDAATQTDGQDTAQSDGEGPGLDIPAELPGDLASDISPLDLPAPHDVVFPAGCCLTEADCDHETVCINTTGAAVGACLAPATATSTCWTNADCDDQGPCISRGPQFAPMDIDCDSIPGEMGLCKGLYTYCCYSDSDCPELDGGPTLICAGLDTDPYGGTCVAAPTQGQCYSQSECPDGSYCEGGFYCPCGYDCEPPAQGPGQCMPLNPPCCASNEACPNGMTCVGESEGALGVCKLIASPGACWEDGECGQYAHCDGAAVCPCDAMCDMEDQIGSCIPNLDECCFADSMCDAGLVCVGAGPGGYPGLCVEAPLAGECWSDGDCALSQTCTSIEFCGCGANCPSFPGTCLPLSPGCCLSDAACNLGETCVGENSGQGICLPIPEGGTCWEDDMCPGGMCDGASYCPCGEMCPMIWPLAPGMCVYPVETCATGYLDLDGVGTPCPNGDSDCQGLGAFFCSTGILNDPSLPPICTRYCSGIETCSAGSFCIDKGWSSSCIPDSCATDFLASCSSDIDCVVATKWDQCCPCPKAVTRSKLATDPCMFEGEIPPPGAFDCTVECIDYLCAECGSAAAVNCSENRCVATWQ